MTCIKAMHDTRDLYLKATAGKIEAGGRS